MGLFNREIVSVEVIDHSTDTKKSAASSLVRGAVGGALLGPAGLLAGGLSGKNKNTNMTTFLITYSDGMSETQTVKNNGMQFNMYMQLANASKGKTDNKPLKTSIEEKYEQAKKLKELLDNNLITQEEFERERENLFK